MEYNRNNLERLGINNNSSNQEIKDAVNNALKDHQKDDLEIDQRNTQNNRNKQSFNSSKKHN